MNISATPNQDTFDIDLLTFTDVTKQTDRSGSVDFIQSLMRYNVSEKDKPKLPYIELPEVTAFKGITSKTFDKNVLYSMNIVLKQDNPDLVQTAAVMDAIRSKCVDHLFANKGALKLPKTASRDTIDGMIPQIAYLGENYTDPSMLISLSTYEGNKTVFKTITGKTIPWEALMNKKVTFCPLLCFTKIYWSGGHKKILFNMKSAVVISIEDQMEFDRQEETRNQMCQNEELMKKNADLEARLAAMELLINSGKASSSVKDEIAEIEDDGQEEEEAADEGEEELSGLPAIPMIGGLSTFVKNAPKRK